MQAWTTDRLKDVATINPASLPANTDPGFEFRYLEISNVDYYGIVSDEAIEQLRFEDAPSRARRIVPSGSTVISSVRPNLQAVAYIDNQSDGLICSTGFNVVSPHRHRLHPRFLYYVMISENARQYFESVATGVGYPAVADKDFSSFELHLPSVSEQDLIAKYLDHVCEVIDAITGARSLPPPLANRTAGVIDSQVFSLLAYRKSLIHECVTGKRRLASADFTESQSHA